MLKFKHHYAYVKSLSSWSLSSSKNHHQIIWLLSILPIIRWSKFTISTWENSLRLVNSIRYNRCWKENTHKLSRCNIWHFSTTFYEIEICWSCRLFLRKSQSQWSTFSFEKVTGILQWWKRKRKRKREEKKRR